MGLYKDIFYVQAGVETTWGCDAAPAVKLMGVESVDIKPIRESEHVKVLDGRLAPSKTVLRTKHGGEATVSGVLSYDDAGLWFDSLFGTLASTTYAGCTTDVAGYVRAYEAPLSCYNSDAGNPAFYTITYGESCSSDTIAFSLISGVVKSLRITGESGAPTRFEASLIGHDVEDDALDATKVDRDVTFSMGSQWAVAIDPDSDAAGTTVVSDVGFKFELNVETNRYLQYHLGDLTPDSYAETEWSGTLMLTLELKTISEAYITSLLSSTPVRKVVKLTSTGDSDHALTITFNGVLLEAPDLWTDVDGVATIELNFEGIYGATLANWLTVTLENQVASNATLT
jgi:hypothetical protein